MFYCDECAEKNGYPQSIIRSHGPCECCGKIRDCSDVPSSNLLKPEEKLDKHIEIGLEFSPETANKISESGKEYLRETIDMFSDLAGTTLFPHRPKKAYPIIKVPANGHPDWCEGARTWCFVYSRDSGNFILEGFRSEVEAYLKANYKHYFCYISMWSHGQSRGHWHFWKDNIGIFSPSKAYKSWKYQIRPYSHTYGHQISKEEIREMTIWLKRLPKRWIPEFNRF
jgi:hypothetical protein